MTIFPGVLKVVGMILLILLVILLVLLALILLSPIRYESVGNAGPDDIQIRLKVTWLFKALRIHGSVTPDKIKVEVKVLFLRVFHRTIPWKYPLIKDTQEQTEETTVQPKEPEAETPKEKNRKTKVSAGKNEAASEPPASWEEKPPEPPLLSAEEVEAISIPETPAAQAEEKYDRLREKWETLSEKAEKVKSLLEQESTWKTVRLVKNCVIRLIRHILPTRARVHGRIGTGDPSLTAKILGLFYMGYPIYGEQGDYRLIGDFENRIVKGKYYIKGRIVPGLAAVIAIRLLLNKNIRGLIFR